MIDDQHGALGPAAASPRRVPAYVAAPVVLACGLIGYAISLGLPLQPTAAVITAKQPAAEPSAQLHAHIAQPEPVAAPSPAPVPVVETGSVQRPAAAPETARAEPQSSPTEPRATAPRAQETRRKRLRRVYRRRYQPAQPVGPVEKLWSLMTK